MLIDYDAYLDGTMWPSESGKPIEAGGTYQPDLKDVYEMPPQYAVNALWKLVRWARDGAHDAESEERAEKTVRNSTLGRLLARRALGIEDFDLYQEHGVDRNALGNVDVAKVICTEMFTVADLDPVSAARLSMELALALNNDGYMIYKVEE